MLIKLSPKPIFIVAMLISLANSLETTESSSSSSSSSQVHDHDDEPILELYMHDILGGNNNDNNPTARPVTGLLGAIYSEADHSPSLKRRRRRPGQPACWDGAVFPDTT